VTQMNVLLYIILVLHVVEIIDAVVFVDEIHLML
jgi:hypothetical protein